jgi:hypothetical protein
MLKNLFFLFCSLSFISFVHYGLSDQHPVSGALSLRHTALCALPAAIGVLAFCCTPPVGTILPDVPLPLLREP